MCHRRFLQTLAIIVLSEVLFVVPSSPTRANVGPEWWGGYASEPSGGLQDIAISRETLDIDLRPLAKGQAVRVEATYRLHNIGSRRRLHLVFVAGSKELKEFV